MLGAEDRSKEGLEVLDIGVGIFDRDLKFSYCNPAFRRLRRYPESLCRDGVGLDALLRYNAERGDFGPGDIEAQVAERIAEIGTAAERELEREMADGQILLIRYRRTSSGGLMVTFEDRTAERLAERALRASEERHALVTRATSDGIYDWNVADDVLYVSENLTGLLNLDLARQSSRLWAEQIHPEDYDAYFEALVAHFKGRTDAVECDYRLRARGGGYRWVHDRGVGVRGADGRVTRLVGAIRDITEIREARAAIDRVEGRLAGAMSTIADGILLVDAENRIELFNDRYVEIFSAAAGGADLSDLVVRGRDFFEMIRGGYEMGMFKPHPEGADGWIAARREAWEKPRANWELELSNGTWILLNERRMRDGGRISVYSDITALKRREAEAQAARERFEEAIEAISSGFALWDADDRLVISNTRYREFFIDLADMVRPGAAFDEIIRVGIERGYFPLATSDVDAYLAGIAEKRLQASGEPREQFIGGKWLQITDHRTGEGGIVSIYTDVTELKTRQIEFEKQSAILELTLENMVQGITLVDRELRTIALNQKFLELMEFPPEQFRRGFTMEQAFRFNAERGEYGPGDIDQQVRQRLALAAEFQPHKFERIRPDGKVIEIVGNPIEGGGFVSTYTDITERKRAYQALTAALAEFNAVLDSIDYGVLFMGPDLRARIVNRAFGRIWNIPQDYIDQHPTIQELIEYNRGTGVYAVAPENWDRWVAERVRAISAGDIAPGEFIRGDGKVLRYQCVALPDGGRMLTYFDITELKQREAEIAGARDAAETALADLQRAQERLIQSEKMASLGQLTAGIAHEIKNPLNFVNNFARLSGDMLGELQELLEAPIAALPEDDRDEVEDLLGTVRGNLDKINEHGRRADAIVRNMLLHSREGPSKAQRVALNPLVQEALNLAYHGARAEDPGFNIDMSTSIDPAVGEVECHPQDLMRVFLNLVSNGIYAASKRRAAEGGGFSPAISLATRAIGERVEVEIRDNGAGIPPELREKIFLPFFTTKPAGEGTGLGLSLSYDIVVKQHGGTLTVESAPGEHTSFVVSVPVRAAGAGP
ncbi:PAS-domain containing protein [Limibaculum sp. FT325]|uniref:PAS-domain containing protein n=1 Tax=Thermohalobaculum sediminis TaxID=2939436 RepID=UPI0020C0BD5D|nr:PAS-domain containing protein [Limibaculum sediminis]MCL5778086.1 PAS-domain containing protein [Limibaculum sediminis]